MLKPCGLLSSLKSSSNDAHRSFLSVSSFSQSGAYRKY